MGDLKVFLRCLTKCCGCDDFLPLTLEFILYSSANHSCCAIPRSGSSHWYNTKHFIQILLIASLMCFIVKKNMRFFCSRIQPMVTHCIWMSFPLSGFLEQFLSLSFMTRCFGSVQISRFAVALLLSWGLSDVPSWLHSGYRSGAGLPQKRCLLCCQYNISARDFEDIISGHIGPVVTLFACSRYPSGFSPVKLLFFSFVIN